MSRLCSPSSRFQASNLDTDTMKNLSLVSPGAIADLNARIDRALTHRDRSALAGVRAIVTWLVSFSPTTDIRQLQARTEAAARFMGGPARV